MTIDHRGTVRPLGAAGGRIRSIGGGDASAAVLPAPVVRDPAAQGYLVLLLTLPLFLQAFHYLIDLGPLYYLSKAWPFLMLPLALRALMSLRAPPHLLYVAALAYGLGITPIMSILWLGNSMVDAMTTTVKLWPATYYFSLLALLAFIRPTSASIRRALVILGLATFAMMWLLWLVVPAGLYAVDPSESKLFIFENERGYRIYMPMSFGVLLVFYIAHRMCDRLRWWHVPAVVFAFASMALIYKQRTVIAAALVVLGWILVRRANRLWRTVLLGFGAIGAIAAAILLAGQAERIATSLGNSLAIRQQSMGLAVQYLLANPLRWLVGVGNTTRFGSVSLSDLFGSRNFYLADLGWLGVLFEYGLIGALLLAGLYIVGLRVRVTEEAVRDPAELAMARSLSAYVLFLGLETAVYSPVFTPGELAAVTALLVYWSAGWRKSSDPVSLCRKSHV